jgi:hypothetical protein
MMKLPNKVVTMVTITILSTTAKVKARGKKAAAKGDSMETVSLGIFF